MYVVYNAEDEIVAVVSTQREAEAIATAIEGAHIAFEEGLR